MQRSKNKSIIIIVIVIAVLCAAIGITAYFNAQNVDSDTDGQNITISVNKEEITTYSLDKLKQFSPKKIHAELSSSSKDDVSGEFTGVPVNKLLNEADKSILENCKNIIFIAGDGYSSALSASEIKDDDSIIMAYEMNGESIKHFNAGGEGPLRLIVGSDTYGNRSTKYIVKIECN